MTTHTGGEAVVCVRRRDLIQYIVGAQRCRRARYHDRLLRKRAGGEINIGALLAYIFE